MVRSRIFIGIAAFAGMAIAAPAPAFLYWTRPAISGAPATGDEPGIVVALPGATPKEKQASLLWAMRAGLNVAALQCQFAPVLRTVPNYNVLLHQHAVELQGAYDTLSAYFRRTAGKTWQTAIDQYTTRTYNGFSTMHAQMSFCETAASLGRDALDQGRGTLGKMAVARMQEFRNSLIPVGDQAFGFTIAQANIETPDLGPPLCYDRKGREKRCR